MRDIQLTYFKPSGKYYMTELFPIPDAVRNFEIPDYVRKNCRKCSGMHIAIDDPKSCPHLVLAEMR